MRVSSSIGVVPNIMYNWYISSGGVLLELVVELFLGDHGIVPCWGEESSGLDELCMGGVVDKVNSLDPFHLAFK
jgi:hypothetical protein